jgi:putative ABC transport system permease protein
VGFLGIARAARSRSGALLPGLALVVALAVIALGGTLRAAVDRGQVAASWQQVGADAVIRTEGSLQDVGPAAQRAIAAVPGVTHTAAVYLVAPGDPQDANLLTGLASSQATGVLIVSPQQYAGLTAATRSRRSRLACSPSTEPARWFRSSPVPRWQRRSRREPASSPSAAAS